MRYIVKATALLVVVLTLLASTRVLAEDYITNAAQALQHALVYVAPNTEGTNSDTAGILQTRLTKKDSIVLVMLPSSAETELGANITTIATRLSEKLENKRIIGLAVGNNVVGYAPALPPGVAADQMRRAKSVSNDPITALSTFAQNIHIWESENPLPSPTPKPPPLDSHEEGGSFWFTWLGISIVSFIVFVVSIAFFAIRNAVTSESTEKTHFKAPDQVKDLLAKIAREREQVNDVELKQALHQMCLDIEQYFAKSSKDKKKDAGFFKIRLTQVAEVLDKYIEVQQNERYYENPETQLEKGKTSIIDFAQYVLQSIRLGHTVDLVDYTVNTKILQAERYR